MKEMNEAMDNIAGEVEPQLTERKKSVRFGYDPIRGEKIRLDKPKKKELSRAEKKREKAKAFWASL